MSIFIAIDVSDEIKEKLEKTQNEIIGDFAEITLVKLGTFHLTLKFLGNISSIKLERIKERLKGINFKNFELELTKIGVFPDRKKVKVIWVGVKPNRKCEDLRNEIEERLRDMFGLDKFFKMHLTLGRVKLIKDANTFFEKIDGAEIQGSFKVRNFKLMSSNIIDDKYETLEVYE